MEQGIHKRESLPLPMNQQVEKLISLELNREIGSEHSPNAVNGHAG